MTISGTILRQGDRQPPRDHPPVGGFQTLYHHEGVIVHSGDNAAHSGLTQELPASDINTHVIT